jgi:hypothetical protein
MGTETEIDELVANIFAVKKVLGERRVESSNEGKHNTQYSAVQTVELSCADLR